MGTIREVLRKDGKYSYHAEVRLKGCPPQRDSFRTITKAKEWIQDIESGIRDGRHFKTREAKKHTVGEMIDKFISVWLPKFPQRLKKQTALLNWWKKQCGHLLLIDFTSAIISECRDQLLQERVPSGNLRSSSTVNRYLSAIGKALTISIKEWGWLEHNPSRNVSKPPEGKGRERFLSLDEKERLLIECKKSRNPNLFPMVLLALHTAMRFGELQGLSFKDISFDRHLITLQKTKNGDKRYIPLTEEAENLLKSLPNYYSDPESLVFSSKRNSNCENKVCVRESFERAVQRANIKDFRFHDLRHTAASYMAMAGATQGELMAILGHRSPQMTRRYAHYSQDHLRKLLERTHKIDRNTKGVS